MKHFILALAALSLSAATAISQESATAPESGGAEAETTAEGLSMGTADTPGEPAIGQTYPKDTIGDWVLQCVKTESGEDPCQMYQLLRDDQGNSVAEVTLFRLNGEGPAVAGATVVVPLETLLTAQLNIAVDDSQGKRYPFAFCNQVGCFSRVGLTTDDVASYKAGNVANVVLVPAAAPDQRVVLPMSLSGFTAAYDQVTVVDNPN